MSKPLIVAWLAFTSTLFGRIDVTSAGPIAIANHSFEAESLPDGVYNVSVVDWT